MAHFPTPAPATRHWLRRTLPTTRWSLIQRVAADPAGPDAETFCRGYWFPLYSFLRQTGYPNTDSEDYVQSFLSSLLESDLLTRADPARGRLRNYLMTLLTRHVADCRERENAWKRGGRALHIPLAWEAAESAWARLGKHSKSPEDIYRAALATQLVADGIAELRRRYAAMDRLDLLEALLPALEGPLPDNTYAETACRLGMSPGALRAASVRMRSRFRTAVQTVASPLLGIPAGPELDAELKAIFVGPAAGPRQ